MRTTIRTFRQKFSSLFQTNPRLAVFSATSLVVFVFGFTLFSFKYLLPYPKVAIAQVGKIENQVQIEPVKVSSRKKPLLEVHIANTGMTYIQGAEVLSIFGSTLVVSTTWNALTLRWTIHTNESYYETRHFGTSFLTRKGDKLSMTDIHVGDLITISGDLEKNSTIPSIMANTIRTSY